MPDRRPTTYDFDRREALVVGRTFQKQGGYVVNKGIYLDIAKRLETVGFVTLAPARHAGHSVVRLTLLGREAWHNHGLRAAGRPPVCLDA